MTPETRGFVPAKGDSESTSRTSLTKSHCNGPQQLLSIIAGVVTGGFVARFGLELMGQPLPRLLIVVVGVLLMGVGGIVAWRLVEPHGPEDTTPSRRRHWALLLLGLYLIWPLRQPSVALFLIMLAVLVAVLDWLRSRTEPVGSIHTEPLTSRLLSWEKAADGVTFVLSFAFYILTVAPDVLPADSGEFQIVASLRGVAHPPGYPLYTLLGWVFTKLIPFGNPAYRLNLMSAFIAAGALTLLGAAARRWARTLGASVQVAIIGGLAAALTLGTATTFWAQATVANTRMPTMFAASLGFYALACYSAAGHCRQADRALLLLALALGLGIGHHPSLIFLGAFFLVYLILVDTRLLVQPRRWWKPLLVAFLTLLPLLYLPLRGAANAPLAPPDLNTVDGFVHHVTAQGFEGDMFAFANAEDFPHRLTLLPTLFLLQFNWVLLVAAGFGLLSLIWRDWRLLVLLAGGLVLHTFVSITYRAPQTVEYLMPAYLCVAISAGLAVAWLLSSPISFLVGRAWAASPLAALGTLLAAVVLLAALVNGSVHATSFFTLAEDRSTREAMESILQPAPPDALILADWRWATPLWYLQWVEGQRPDVEVRYVYPQPGQEIGDTWRDRVDAVIGEQPLLLTHAYEFPGYTLEPFGWGFWIHQRPHREAPVDVVSTNALFSKSEAQGGVRVLGYRLYQSDASPGQALELTLAWQAEGELATPPSFTVGLISGDGQRLTQADRYLGSDYTPGEVRFERLVLPLYPNIPPGGYDLALQVYSTGEQGFETWPFENGVSFSLDNGPALKLMTLPVQPGSSRSLSLHPLAVPYENGPMLIGVDYDRSIADTLRLYLHWRGPAQGGEQITVGESKTRLPELPEGTFQTVILDLPGEASGGLWLTLTGTDGRTRSLVGPWGWPQQGVRLPPPAAAARFVPLADEMALIGVTPAEGQTFSVADELPVRLTFVALKPLTVDNAVSVRLLDQAGQWRYLHDIQPALGAIPTLKWIRGSRIVDLHPLPIPIDVEGDAISAALVVYERFRGILRPPMDGRMVDVPLGVWLLAEQ